MGCDIHAYVEIKTENGWELWQRPDIGRNYRIFAKLADVRNRGGIKPIVDPKGLPKDMSFIVSKEWEIWDLDGHNTSYLNREELKLFSEWYNEEYDSDLEWDWSISIEDLPEYAEDIRFIFWFDN